MKLKYRCLISGCDFDSETRIGLQKHYEQDHTYIERVKSSLVLSGGEYLPLTHRGHSEDVRKKLAAIMMLVCGLMMITAHLNFAVAADDEGGDSGGGGGDSGGDSGGNNDSGGGSNDGGGDSGGSKEDNNKESNDGGGDKQSNSQQKDEGGTQEEDKQEQEKDTELDRGTSALPQPQAEPDNNADSASEKEQAAIDDYINEEPGIKKPYPPVVPLKPGEGIHPGKPISPITDCKKFHDACDKPRFPSKEDGWKGDGWKGNGDNNHWCKWHHCGHEDHDHHRHNHKHNHHNDHSHYDNHDHNYYYYYSNDYNNNNHATVILQPDYSHSNDYHDIRVVIGDDYMFDTVINFAGEPENLVITGLDLNEGEQFDVCMHNEHNDEVNCVSATLHDEDKAVYVDIRVP